MAFKTRQQIALELGISARTLSRWIKKENIDVNKGLLSPRDQVNIKDRLGILEPAVEYQNRYKEERFRMKFD